MDLKVAMIQFAPVLGDMETNISRITSLMQQAAGARLVVLPELAGSGYNFSTVADAYACSETPGKGKFLDFLAVQSRQFQTHIVSGFIERQGDDIYNASALVGPDGVLSIYRKTHLFMNEKDLFRSGEGEMPVVDIGGVKVGMLICFDYLFPEVWRMQAMKGADIICHPSNLLTQNAHRCMPGLALMNRIYIVTANRIGQEGDLRFNGQSFMTDPFGEVLVKASETQEAVIHGVLHVEHSRYKWVTRRNHAFKDRRPDLYR